MTAIPPRHRILGRRLAAITFVALLVLGAPVVSSAGAAQSTPDLPAEPALHVALDEDGSARVTLVVPFDLASPAERAAFDALRSNDSAMERRAERFASSMSAIAERTADEHGREMSVSRPASEFVVVGDTGLVALSVTWDGLATRSGDALVLREPFAGDVELDRTLYVDAPAGYGIAAATPAPTARSDGRAAWSPTTDLTGFEVRFEPDPTASGTSTAADAPGFGVGVAIVALALTAGLVWRRRRPPA